MGSGEKTTFVLKQLKGRHVKDTFWYEVYVSVVTNWSELTAEQKSEKCVLVYWFILLGIMLMMLIYWGSC